LNDPSTIFGWNSLESKCPPHCKVTGTFPIFLRSHPGCAGWQPDCPPGGMSVPLGGGGKVWLQAVPGGSGSRSGPAAALVDNGACSRHHRPDIARLNSARLPSRTADNEHADQPDHQRHKNRYYFGQRSLPHQRGKFVVAAHRHARPTSQHGVHGAASSQAPNRYQPGPFSLACCGVKSRAMPAKSIPQKAMDRMVAQLMPRKRNSHQAYRSGHSSWWNS